MAQAPFIITSKTRRSGKKPNGRTMVMPHPETGDNRICDERYAEDHLRRGVGWADPQSIRGVTDQPD